MQKVQKFVEAKNFLVAYFYSASLNEGTNKGDENFSKKNVQVWSLRYVIVQTAKHTF